MRQFLVLGYATNSNSEQGEQVHLGSDRGEAIAVTNEPDERFARKQLYELALPHMSRHFDREQVKTTKKKTSKKASDGTGA